jgi:hypothetical protein
MLDDQTLPAQRTYVLDHITNNHELFASFTAETMYTLTSTADTGGHIAPFGNIEKKENEIQIYQISPDDHYTIANVYIDDMAMGKMSSIAVKADANHRIHASFESIEAYTIQGHIRAQDTLNPLVAYWVELWKDEVFLKGVYTDSQGAYQFTGLEQSDNYIIAAWPPVNANDYKGQFYLQAQTRDTANRLTILDHDLVDIDLSLEPKPLAGFSGQIRMIDHTPVAHTSVDIFLTDTTYVSQVITDQMGVYTITGLNPDTAYFVSYWHQASNKEFYYSNLSSEITPVTPTIPIGQQIDIIVRQGETISGEVLDAQNEPVAGVLVNAWSDYFNEGNSSITNEQGLYTITGLTSVSNQDAFESGYIVEISDKYYPYQIYPYSDIKELGQRIGSNESQINFKLRKGNQISGIITTQDGDPMPDVEIIAWSEKQSDRKTYSTRSDANGAYTFTFLKIADDYIVGAFPENTAPQFYDHKDHAEIPTDVNLMDNHQYNIDFTIDVSIHIKGDVFIETEAVTKAGMTIEISSKSMQFFKTAQTNESGHFEMSGLNKTANDYLMVIREQDCLPFILENLQPSDIPKTIFLQQSIIISGKVSGNGQHIGNASIHAQSLDGERHVYAICENGFYTLTGLKAGEWKLIIQADGYLDDEQNLDIVASASDIDFNLQGMPLRSISGTIVGLNDSESLNIQAWSVSKNAGKTIHLTGNGEAMDFFITSLQPSADYTLELISEHFQDIYYHHANTAESAQKIDILQKDVSGIVIRVNQDKMSEISGVLTFPDSTEYGQNVLIHLISDHQIQSSGSVTFTGSFQESYVIQGIPAKDNYILYAESSDFKPAYYDGTENGTDTGDKAKFINLSHKPAENINMTMTVGRQISGTITDMNGNPMQDMRVAAWSERIQHGNESKTNSNGQYRIMGLRAANDYVIKLISKNSPLFYYASESTTSNINQAAKINVLLSDAIIDMSIQKGEAIDGFVRTNNHLPLENIWISAWSDIHQAGNGVFTNSEGKFEIKGLPESKDYKLMALPDTNQPYKSKIFKHISTGEEVTFILEAASGLKLLGQVLNNSNMPISDVKIEIESASDRTIYAWTTTDESGHFSFSLLPEKSDYILQVWPNNSFDAIYVDYPVKLTQNREISIQLEPGLVISGIVTQKSDQTPLKDIPIRIASASFQLDIIVQTDKNGFYEWPNARQSDDYIITAACASTTYIPVQKINQMPSENINFILESSGTISGRVTYYSNGKGVENSSIEIYAFSQTGHPDYEGSVLTDERGYFQVSNLMKFNSQGVIISDYRVVINAPGYPEIIRTDKKAGDIVNVVLKKDPNLTLNLSVEYPGDSNVILGLFNKNGNFIKYCEIKSDGTYTLSGLNKNQSYELLFIASGNDVDLEQWAGDNDTGVLDRNDARSYKAPDTIHFKFDLSQGQRKRSINPGNIQNIYSITQSFRAVRNQMSTESANNLNVPPISNQPNISVNWDSKPDQKFYTSFSDQSDHAFTIFNTIEKPPIRTRKISSRDLEGDDVNYYFHVASVDKEGRIGNTTSIAFRIDTIPPQNVCVIPPEITDSRNIQLQLGASGASEIYISNLNYQEGGTWENFRQDKIWEIERGYGSKMIYVRFRDRADNQTRMSGETLFHEPVPTFTIKATSSEHGEMIPQGIIDAPQGSENCFDMLPDDGYRLDRFILDQQAMTISDNQYCFSNIQAAHSIQATFTNEQFRIRSVSDHNGQIWPSGDIYLNKGDHQTFVITPKEGFQIDRLTVNFQNKTSQNNTFTIVDIQEDHEIFVTFKRVYQISATMSGKGKIEPSGIVSVDCGKAQSFQMIAEPGYTVDRLSIDEQQLNHQTEYTFFNINENHSIHATFTRELHTIEAVEGIGGTIEPKGLISVASGETQHFTIRPNQGYTINQVIVDGQNLLNSLKRSETTFYIESFHFDSVNDNHTIMVNFMPLMHIITSCTTTNGSIMPSGDIFVHDGESMTFTLIPSSGYALDQLRLDDQPVIIQNNQYTIDTITSDHDLCASFKRVYHITSISGAGGSLKPEGSILADKHTSLTFTIIPDPRYGLEKLTSNGMALTAVNNGVTLNDIDQDQTLIASFKLKQFTILTQSDEHGKIIPEGQFMVDAGSDQTFYVQPSVGCQIKTVKVNDKAVLLSGNQYTLENITNNYTIQAEFVVINNAPASDDQHLTLFEDTAMSGTLNANDLDNDPLTFSIQTQTFFGTLSLTEKGVSLV